jgi:NAD+ kinase
MEDNLQKIFIFTNLAEESYKVKDEFIEKVKQKDKNIIVSDELTEDVDLIVCIGGDGALLNLVQRLDFPGNPIVGINTGTLGFFQDILPSQMDDFIDYYMNEQPQIETHTVVQADIFTKEGLKHVYGLNEIIVTGVVGCIIHMNISIGGSFIERFSGDGIIVSTPAGSTAYNYSLGGSIVDPRLKLLQVTPIAPMNTTAYRSFTSSLILPSEQSLIVVPDMNQDAFVSVSADGFVHDFHKVEQIHIHYSDYKKIRMVKYYNYDFWRKVKEKFLSE